MVIWNDPFTCLFHVDSNTTHHYDNGTVPLYLPNLSFIFFTRSMKIMCLNQLHCFKLFGCNKINMFKIKVVTLYPNIFKVYYITNKLFIKIFLSYHSKLSGIQTPMCCNHLKYMMNESSVVACNGKGVNLKLFKLSSQTFSIVKHCLKQYCVLNFVIFVLYLRSWQKLQQHAKMTILSGWPSIYRIKMKQVLSINKPYLLHNKSKIHHLKTILDLCFFLSRSLMNTPLLYTLLTY